MRVAQPRARARGSPKNSREEATIAPTDTKKRGRGRPRDDGLTARRREDILDAATRTFAARGLAGTDLQAIADELGLGKGTLYRYFPSKRELFDGAVDRALRRLRESVEAAARKATDPLDLVARAFRTHLAFFDDAPELVELLVQERAALEGRARSAYFAHRDSEIGPWLEVIGSLVADGRFRALPARRIADVISDLLYGSIFTDRSGGERSLKARSRDLLDVLLEGVLSEEERRRRRRATAT